MNLAAIVLNPEQPKPEQVLAASFDHLDVADWIRVYYKVDDEEARTGFVAVIVEMTRGCGGGSDADIWVHPDSDVQSMGHVVAMFDGIRHLYLGEGGKGYIHYPDLPKWTAVLAALADIQQKHCRDS